MRRTPLFITLVCLCPFIIFAQSGVNSGQGELNGASGSVDYSIGQVFFSEHTPSSYSYAEGIHGYEISTIGDILIEGVSLEIAVYPNPAIDYFTLSFESEVFSGYTAALTSQDGRRVLEWEINEQESTTEIAHLLPGVYLLSIINKGTIMKTFQIIKK